jgi:hypothetical protein
MANKERIFETTNSMRDLRHRALVHQTPHMHQIYKIASISNLCIKLKNDVK